MSSSKRLSVNVNLRPHSELRRGRAPSIRMDLIALLSVSDILSKMRMKRVEVHCEFQGGCRSQIAFRVNGKVRVVTLVRKEWRNTSGFGRSVVVGEFSERKECRPVVLLIGNIMAKVLLLRLVNPFGLTVRFGVVSRSEVQLHVERGSKRPKESGNEFSTAVQHNMRWNPVFSKDMLDKECSQFHRGDLIHSRNEYQLLG